MAALAGSHKGFASGRTITNADAFDIATITLTRTERRISSSMAGSVALFIRYLLLATPVGAVFLCVAILSLPVWTLTKD